MYKTSVICSLLMALGASAVLVGCEPPKTAVKTPPAKAGAGSTTGGGAEVPTKPAAGEAEKPAPPKTDEAPKVDAPKADEAAPKTEAPKTEEAPK